MAEVTGKTGKTGKTEMAQAAARAAAHQPAPAQPNQGWYFYGIAARDERLAAALGGISGMPGGGAFQVIAQGAVAALVQPVPLAEFGREALAARLEDLAWIEEAARRHYAVIATVYQHRTILPARFGAVYTAPADMRAVLAQTQDALRAQLARVTGCDEWEVRLYGERDALLRHLDDDHPALAESRREMEAATPGRAYLLRRKLEGERERVAAASLCALADGALDQLARHATAGQKHAGAQRAGRADAAAQHEEEVLRADFLVPRARLAEFVAAMDGFAAEHAGTRWVRTGPWPPYSFATPLDPRQMEPAR